MRPQRPCPPGPAAPRPPGVRAPASRPTPLPSHRSGPRTRRVAAPRMPSRSPSCRRGPALPSRRPSHGLRRRDALPRHRERARDVIVLVQRPSAGPAARPRRESATFPSIPASDASAPCARRGGRVLRRAPCGTPSRPVQYKHHHPPTASASPGRTPHRRDPGAAGPSPQGPPQPRGARLSSSGDGCRHASVTQAPRVQNPVHRRRKPLGALLRIRSAFNAQHIARRHHPPARAPPLHTPEALLITIVIARKPCA